MARVAGYDLNVNKRVHIALTYIRGIGRSTAVSICESNDVPCNMRLRDMSSADIAKLSEYIDAHCVVGSDLSSRVILSIRRLIKIKSYRGWRHKSSLPVRGQRTRSNAKNARRIGNRY